MSNARFNPNRTSEGQDASASLCLLFEQTIDAQPAWTVRQCLELAADFLSRAGIDSPRLEARLLLAQLLVVHTGLFYSQPGMVLDDSQYERVRNGISRRIRHEPSAYILGKAGFYGREFLVDASVLIPRADTEILIDHVLELSSQARAIRLLDTCTGSGCIGITLALELIARGFTVHLDLADINASALAIARKNLERYELTAMARCYLADLWPQADGLEKWNLITANPPYIPRSDLLTLEPDVRWYEPEDALDGGRDGLVFYRRLCAEGAAKLCKGGHMILEHGFDQSDAIERILIDHSWQEIRRVKDLNGHWRVLSARKENDQTI